MIKEKYAKVFIEESFKTQEILKEDAQFGMYLSPDQGFEYFVQPFKDILDVAKIALKDIGSGVLYNLRMTFTFSTTKKARLLEAYKQSRENYKKEYGPIMDRVNKGLGEAKLLAFLAAPHVFLAAEAVKQGVGAAKFVGDVFVEQSKALDGEGPNEPTKPDDGPLLGALSDLKRIFFGEAYIVGTIMEAGGENPDVEAEIAQTMEEMGVDTEAIQSAFSQWIKDKEQILIGIEEEGVPNRINALVKMMQSQNYPELEKSVSDAKSHGVDLGNFIKQFKTEFEKSREELTNAIAQEKESAESEDPSNVKASPILTKLRKMPQIKKLGEKATDEDYINALEESLFVTLKSNLQVDGDRILNDIKSDISEMLEVVIGPFKTLEELKELRDMGPEGAAIASKMENTYKLITGI